MRTFLAVALALSLAPTAYASDTPFTPAFYQGVEVGTQPGFYESYDEAIAYWAAVPGVPSLEDACGPPPQIFSVVNDPRFGGYGAPRTPDGPCRIWAEESYIKRTDELPAWLRDLERCQFVVHELGHTLGLEHKDYGDPAKSMVSGTIPEPCEATYTPPKAPQPIPEADPLRVICMPAWAFYGPKRVMNLYLHDQTREARQAFKRWARRHRWEARGYESKAAICSNDFLL